MTTELSTSRRSLLPVPKGKQSDDKRRNSVDYVSFLVPKSMLTSDAFKAIHISIEQEERKLFDKPKDCFQDNATNKSGCTAKEKENLDCTPQLLDSLQRRVRFSNSIRSAKREMSAIATLQVPAISNYLKPTQSGLFRSKSASKCCIQKSRSANLRPPMSVNDLRHGYYSPSTPSHYGSLARSATTSRVPKAFGEKTYMNKDDHERERARWMTKLDEIEARLAESEILNSDMHQIKAELNKRIIDLERTQKPLIDQNRRISERNKILSQELKKIEQNLCHSQDDYLTLKDAHERLVKENSSLKEKRAYPEKLEELERYKQQVLEYSKCITALRSAGLEKDRRYEMLVQKFKRLRKCIRKAEMDDDGRSIIGSDCSGESSINLDTINEDFEESLNKDIETNYQALYKENAELHKALHELKLQPVFTDETLLRDQLLYAQTTIAQQQLLLEGHQEMLSQSATLKSLVASQQARIKELEETIEKLKNEVAVSKDANELLEFQVLELEENSKSEDAPRKSMEKSVDTEEQFEALVDIEISKENINGEDVAVLKKSFSDLKNAVNLRLAQRHVVGQAEGYIGNLEDKVSTFAEERKSNAAEYETKIKDLQSQIEISYSKQKKKKELQIEVEELRKNLAEMDNIRDSLNDQMKTLSKELNKLRAALQTKDSELEKEKKLTDGLNSQLQELVHSHQLEKEMTVTKLKELETANETMAALAKEKEEILSRLSALSEEYEKFKEEQRPSIRTELERRYEETRYRLNAALEKLHRYETVIDTLNKNEDGKLSEALQEDLVQLKDYNEHLERQFRSQTDIIDALKNKVVQQKTVSDFVNKVAQLEDTEYLHNELRRFSQTQQNDQANLINNIAYMVEMAGKNSLLASIAPLEISTAHHKIRPYSSVDSSGEWMSNSSEGVPSPDEIEHEQWNKNKGTSVGTSVSSSSPASTSSHMI